jgi:asparagine synthase (glutamine-hydrolysing)
MCGIAGIINQSNTQIDANQLKFISDLMQHRGPDSQGFYTNNNVGFAHNRLSLLDLS